MLVGEARGARRPELSPGGLASQRLRPASATTEPTTATSCRDSGALGLGPGGRLVSVENDAGRRQEAAEKLAAVRLTDAVDLVLADAKQVLTDTPTGWVDLLFLDAGRSAYVDYWPELLRVLRPGGLLAVADGGPAPRVGSGPARLRASGDAVGGVPVAAALQVDRHGARDAEFRPFRLRGDRCQQLSAHERRRAADADERVGRIALQCRAEFTRLDGSAGQIGGAGEVGAPAVGEARGRPPPTAVGHAVRDAAADQQHTQDAGDDQARATQHG